jgi:glycosyltransferase involved in cell wall biosynthesis
VSRPLVSVVIPVYNAEPFLRETLDSVLAQDYEPFEVIVVDDGSTDGSGAIARSYPEVRYLLQENQGPAVARNAGIAAARGEFLAFFDADDVMLPNKLSVQVGYLLEHPAATVTLAKQVSIGTPPEATSDTAWSGAPDVQPTSVVLRKSTILEIGGFDPAVTPTDDFDLLIRLRERGHRLEVLPEVVMHRRYHGGNLVLGRGVDKGLPARLIKAKLDRERSAAEREA